MIFILLFAKEVDEHSNVDYAGDSYCAQLLKVKLEYESVMEIGDPYPLEDINDRKTNSKTLSKARIWE